MQTSTQWLKWKDLTSVGDRGRSWNSLLDEETGSWRHDFGKRFGGVCWSQTCACPVSRQSPPRSARRVFTGVQETVPGCSWWRRS